MFLYVVTLVKVTVTYNYCVSVSLMVKPVKRFNVLGYEDVLWESIVVVQCLLLRIWDKVLRAWTAIGRGFDSLVFGYQSNCGQSLCRIPKVWMDTRATVFGNLVSSVFFCFETSLKAYIPLLVKSMIYIWVCCIVFVELEKVSLGSIGRHCWSDLPIKIQSRGLKRPPTWPLVEHNIASFTWKWSALAKAFVWGVGHTKA